MCVCVCVCAGGSNFYTATRRHRHRRRSCARARSQISCSPSYYKSGFNSTPSLFRFSFAKLLASDTCAEGTGGGRGETTIRTGGCGIGVSRCRVRVQVLRDVVASVAVARGVGGCREVARGRAHLLLYAAIVETYGGNSYPTAAAAAAAAQRGRVVVRREHRYNVSCLREHRRARRGYTRWGPNRIRGRG